MNILLVILYLILGLIISFNISYFYLKHYRGEKVKFAFYFTVINFGFVIFFIFLIPFDITVSVLYPDFNFLNFLSKYYLIFGYYSQLIGDVIAPILILIETTGFYIKKEIFKDVLKRFLTDYVSMFKLIFVNIVSIPTISYCVAKKVDIFELFRTILLYLNFFPYLEMLYYIGFVCQDLAYSYFRQKEFFRLNYDIWKLGKIYKYFERENLKLSSREKKIINITKKIKYKNPEFESHYINFIKRIEESKINLITVNFDQEEIQKMKKGTNEYKMEKKDEHIKDINNLYEVDNNNNNVSNNVGNNEENFIEHNDIDEQDDKYMELIYNKVVEDENELKKDLGIYEKLKLDSDNSKDIESDISSDYEDWEQARKEICELMTEAIESSNFIQRKSFLLDQKCLEIIRLEKNGEDSKNPLFFLLIVIFYIIVFIFEMPWSVYDRIPDKMKSNFFKNISIPFFSTVFYFFIYNYAIIEYKYMQGDLIFGKNKSGNVNFYNFISYVLGNCDAAFYHSIWVLRKYKVEKNEYHDKYDFFPKYFEVFELPEIKGFNFIPHISMILILISIFYASKFSNFKIKKKQVFLFNENADFFYNEKNLYTNFIRGCFLLISFKKNNFKKKDNSKNSSLLYIVN